MTQVSNSNNQRIWFDPAILKEAEPKVFESDYWQDKGKVIGSAQGRGTTWFVSLDSMDAALRHYRRGGLLGKIIQDHYIFTGWKNTRSYQEFELLKLLAEQGVNVPKPIAARAIKRTFCYQADLISEKIPNARDLVSLLQESSLPAELYKKIGQQIALMHNAQVNHTDLNIHNILVDDQQKVWIIDFDKCYLQAGDSWKSSNLERLKRSFLKELKKRNIHWSESEWQFILKNVTL